ncbi:D-2-hydroxyacid dehydrogenase [Veronia nyctiphanis]|uniref:D-2-hydroxyacid dehydrogenase n=1 Tax=Veronia nyctiphanis TaxID=1278244 RepID=A0A4Q0YNE7_9GAMM|nr:D-2-hydroxyacid dehydrogenase [Veronia nyctiphanis]RXJ72366.1 D-2-hydroxyacid dehydrogenase [Veronia nyctiphanis]
MNRVFILSDHSKRYRELLNKHALPQLQPCDDIRDANIVLADPPKVASLLHSASSLEWLQSTFAGCDAVLAHTKRDYTLTNVRGIFGPLIAEYVLGHLLNHTRHLAIYRKQQQQAEWQPHAYSSLAGKHMLILGTGSIGSHLAETAKLFGMTVSGLSRSGNPTAPFDTVYATSALDSALAQADVVVSTLPYTPETHHLLNEESLGQCQQALLFNVGRGGVLSEQGLIKALDDGAVEHAFLDVFATEPLSEAHPFWDHPKVSVTPHIAAVSFPDDVFACFRQNYLNWYHDKPLDSIVDFERGY